MKGRDMKPTITPIHEIVRAHYSKAARSSSQCCSPSAIIYPAEILNELPTEIGEFSLGCGNPINAAALKPGETVLDLGSGGGLDCFLAARRVGSSGKVIGVDMTTEMLERARENSNRLGFTNVEFREGYLENLPLDDQSVDVVISNCVINLSPDKPQVFREIFRVLKPGGRLAVSDIVTNGELPKSIRNNMDAWGACVAGALDMQDYSKGLIQTGFEEVKVQPKTYSDELLHVIPFGQPFSAIITALKPFFQTSEENL
jgi:arsenite methyltransferase